MRLAQAGIPGAVALLGTQMSAVQAAWLSRAPRVVLLFDGDEAGERASRQVVTLIGGNTRVRVHDLPSGLEPEDLDDDALRSLVRPT
jgi:DNA primase